MKQLFRNNWLSLPVRGVLIAFFLALAGNANAMCVYVHTDSEVIVDMNGIHVWRITPPNSHCTDGTGGRLFLGTPVSMSLSVDDHGYVKLYNAGTFNNNEAMLYKLFKHDGTLVKEGKCTWKYGSCM